ncbi:LCP family protein [Actinomadura kijaniata]|uniref:LCP family protein n=1 Tax=Actinomadura kijaniata TaxID=46161 RepID=UPI00082A5EB8|nr:LCP family protein [Actinomadura kijaniata]
MYDGGPIRARLEAPRPAGDGTGPEEPDLDPIPPWWARSRRSPALPRLAEALALTALSVVMPGLAHLRAGRVRAGAALLTGYALTLTALAVAAGRARERLLELLVSPEWLAGLIAGCAVAAVAWVALVARSYAVLRPAALSARERRAGRVAVAALCALALAPPLTVARYGQLQRDLVGSVFADDPAATAPDAVPAAPPAPPADPLRRLERLNVLLVGGDADVGRPGVRTDSMTVASIDTRTGDTVLLSLPRNLQNVPVWSGRRRVPFPRRELLNAVYQHGLTHPGLVGGGARNPGAELLKRTVGHILGRRVHYYAMVDMRSFRQIVDAVGGVRVCVDRAVPVPRQQIPGGVLRPGCRRLNGREALWYGRSRTGGDDYGRMGRQKCLMWEIARQAGPWTVLRSFQRLSRVFRYSVNTDLPRGTLPHLVALSARIRNARVTSLQFVPPLVSPARPDYPAIRRTAERMIENRGSAVRTRARLHILNQSCT